MKTIDEYINAQPPGTKDALLALKQCILLAAPNSTELFNYNIPAFALTKGGKRDHQIMMAGYKKHVGLYPHPTTIAHFSEQLKGYKCGKGSVQFPINKALPKELIIEMVQYRKALIDAE